MKVKLDENLPRAASRAVEAFGHDVDTVVDEGLGGESDARVLAEAGRAGRFLMTLDRGFGDVRRYPPGSHQGIAVLRVEVQDPPAVEDALGVLLTHHDLDDLVGCIVVVRGRLVRIRRPG